MTEIFSQSEYDALDCWLKGNVAALGDGPLETDLITGGSSNIVVKLSRRGSDKSVVLRKAPTSAPPASAKAISREATVLGALRGSAVPHPSFFGYCDDASVVGGPFYVMDLVDGWAATVTTDNATVFPARFSGGPDQHYLGYAMIDGMIAMANLDYIAAGLESYGKSESYLPRQVARWRGQMEGYPRRYPGFEGRNLAGFEYVSEWLTANLPNTGRPGLMHGDFALNNVLFSHSPPSRIVSIIDWETSTIGDPLMDLAGFVQSLRRADGRRVSGSYFDNRNFPVREDAIAYYRDQTGRDVSTIDYYIILYKFRMACILEYKVAEAAVGISSQAKGRRFDGLVRRLFLEAEDLARSAG